MSIVEYEAMNVVTPLKNSGGLRCVAVIAVSGTPRVDDLEALFGGAQSAGAGHFYTLHCDGPKVYVAFGSASGTIDPTAQGVSTLACWPIPADQQRDWRTVGGREGYMGPSGAYQGVPTTVRYTQLHSVGASPGSPTGFLRIYRSSLGPGEGSEQFRGSP